MTTALDHVLRIEYEKGYQAGLHDGLMAAHQNSNGRTPSPDSAEGKHIIAIGNATGLTAVDEDYLEDYRILRGPMAHEQELEAEKAAE